MNELIDRVFALKKQLQDMPDDPALTEELAIAERDLQLSAHHDELVHDVRFALGQAVKKAGEKTPEPDPALEKYNELLDAYNAALMAFRADKTSENAAARNRARRTLDAFRESQEHGDPEVIAQAVKTGTAAYRHKKDKNDEAALARGERALQFEYADTFNDAENDFDADADEAQAMINDLPEQQRVPLQTKLDVLRNAKKAYREAHLSDGFDFDALQKRPTKISAELWKKFSAEIVALQQNMVDFVENVRNIFNHRRR